MRYLIDTGILARLHHRDDPLNEVIQKSLFSLRENGHVFVTSTQNIAELWSLLTRPAEARGGFGFTIEAAHKRLMLVEQLAAVLREPESSHANWRQLIIQKRVMGMSTHDARIVALMKSYRIKRILTLNDAHFRRYSEIECIHPSSVTT